MGKKQKPKPQQKRRQQQRQKKKESSPREKGLPVDIVREILVRCPVKTLAKFRCVCKQWGSIISQPSFQEDHYCQNTRVSPRVLLTRCQILRGRRKKVRTSNILHFSTYTSNGTLVNQFSKTYLHRCSYIPIQSCRGLVCFGSRHLHHPILISNPSTMELITLPRTEGINLTIGFGYADSTKEFKVVRFFSEFNDDAQVCCEVFTLGTSRWREARNPPPQYPPDFFTWGAPFLHGALHMVADRSSIGNYGDVLSIEAFDIDKEEYTKIPLPEYGRTVKRSFGEMYLKEFEGSLCLVFELVRCLDIWCLKDYHNREWVKKYTIDFPQPRTSDIWVDLLAIMDDGNMMLNMEVKDEEALYYYDFHDKSFKKATGMNCWGTLYVETLLPLGSSL